MKGPLREAARSGRTVVIVTRRPRDPMTPQRIISGRHQVNGTSRQFSGVHAGAARRERRR
jgi:hypothetical protein